MAVPFFTLAPTIDEIRSALDAAYARVLDGGQFIRGPELATFEADFAGLAGTAHAVGVGNGHDALMLVLRALDIGPGDEVIVPCHTFIATWLAVSALGARPVPVDVDPTTFGLSAETAAPAITSRTRALIAVHLYGQPVDADPLARLCAGHGIALIEDAAQAHGALYRDRPVGSLGRAAAFSFYPTKGLGAFGDGGAVTTDDGSLARRVRRLGNYGSDEAYRFAEAGVNSRLDELQAAFLAVRLGHLERWNAARRERAARYLAGLDGLPVTLPAVPAWSRPVWHLFVIRTADRAGLQRHLSERGIGTHIHYPVPPHRQKAYADAGLVRHDLAVSEALAREVLSLPLWPQIADDDVDAVIAAIRDYFA